MTSPWALELAERGWLPDPLLRHGIRRLLSDRLRDARSGPGAAATLAEAMRRSPLAVAPDAANAQHYELPPAFFETVLGSRLKYSCCWWPEGVEDLDTAERLALELTAQRAGIEDGMRVLDLGCGWGSLSLWVAEHYPSCEVTAVSNSEAQGTLVRQRAAELGLRTVDVLTADMNDLGLDGELDDRFDRVVSVEMFEHMRNYELLLERIAGWLAADGKLFVHLFCHHTYPYFFEDNGPDDWMARHFFTGGLMPAETLLDEFAGPLELEDRWRVNGTHYSRTLLAWLARMDDRRSQVRRVLRSTYGADAERCLQRWRIFFLSCAELFGCRDGEEWFVSHSLWHR